MGLLDDAIREHLDLKRRRGADADEVARQEDEALGPPRTGQFATPPAGEPALGGAREPVVLEPVVPDLPPEPDFADPPPPGDDAEPPAGLEPAEPADGLEPPAAVAASGVDAPPARPEFTDEAAWLEDEPAPEPPPPQPPPTPEPDAEAPTGEEDVLEETPDFLQETPEHDRLWFEQRPPRDFDFDK